MVRVRDLSNNTWKDDPKESLPKVRTFNDGIVPTQFLDVATAVRDGYIYTASFFLDGGNGGTTHPDKHDLFVRRRTLTGTTWGGVDIVTNSPSHLGTQINTHGIDLHALEDEVLLTLSRPQDTTNNWYDVGAWSYIPPSGSSRSEDRMNTDRVGAGFTPVITSNKSGVHYLWETRDNPASTEDGAIYATRFVTQIEEDSVCKTTPSITADHTFWTGEIIIGNDSSQTTGYECITIPPGKTVSMDENAHLYLRGNRLYVQGSLYYYSNNTTEGMLGEVICDSGTVVDLSTGNGTIEGTGACIYIAEGGKYKIKNADYALTFKDDALMIIDGGELEIADGVKLHFDSTSQKLDIRPGSTIKMGDGAEIVIESKIEANGTADSTILITSSYSSPTTSQYWKWIKIVGAGGSGETSFGEIEYATLEYSDYGAYVSNVPNLEIKNNTIQYQKMSGLYLYSSFANIDSNTITHSDLLHGIYLNDSSPELYGNTITNHDSAGVYCYNYSSPSFGSSTTTTKGHNVIKDNYYGVHAHSNSNPFLGDHVSGRIGGYNSLYDNSSANMKASSGSDVKARYNWWGSDPVDTRLMDIDGTSEVDYGDALSQDPNSSSKMSSPSGKDFAKGDDVPLEYTPGQETPAQLLDLAQIERLEKNYSEAISLLKDIVNLHPFEDEAVLALSIIADVYREAKSNEAISYFTTVAASHVNTEVRSSANELIRREHIMNGDFQSAITHGTATLLSQPAEEIEKNVLYDLVVMYHEQEDDTVQANAYYQQLESQYPNSELTLIAGILMDQADSHAAYSKGTSRTALKTGHSETVDQFKLFSNYPNPFNPSTTLRFSIVDNRNRNATVKLAIFNNLGQEVSVLVDEKLEAGEHQRTWNGRYDSGVSASSGVYYARLQVGNQSATRKILLLK